MSSIAVQVDDIDATVAFLERNGVRVASRVGHHIVFTHPADTGGVVIEWFGDEEPLDPRFGAPMPPPVAAPLLDVTRMAFAGAVVDDPAASAARLAHLFGHGFTLADRPPTGAPSATVSMGDVQIALYPMPRDAAESRRLWGHTYHRPQTSNLGVLVPDLATARESLTAASVPIHRDDDAGLVIAPEVTGGVAIVVADHLLDGDPRR